jgi:hypothetical protein
VNLDPGVIAQLTKVLKPRAWLRVTRLKFKDTPLGMGFGETRFASPSDAYHLLYIGQTLTTAVAETIVRDTFVGQIVRTLTQEQIEEWGVTTVRAVGPLSLLDLPLRP